MRYTLIDFVFRPIALRRGNFFDASRVRRYRAFADARKSRRWERGWKVDRWLSGGADNEADIGQPAWGGGGRRGNSPGSPHRLVGVRLRRENSRKT